MKTIVKVKLYSDKSSVVMAARNGRVVVNNYDYLRSYKMNKRLAVLAVENHK